MALDDGTRRRDRVGPDPERAGEVVCGTEWKNSERQA
jgi:hypothetical protein